jgi:uncharacterized protein with HEPN domain
MQRDERAYLNDIVEACTAIESALSDLDLTAYRANRLVRSAADSRTNTPCRRLADCEA